MKKGFNSTRHRNSNRLPNYDYSQIGAYFITIVTQNRACLLGSIVDGEMILNDVGKMIDQVFQEMPRVIKGIEVNPYQIMPNHVHAIISLNQFIEASYLNLPVGADLRVCPGQPQRVALTDDGKVGNRITLFNVLQRFKSLTTRRYINGVQRSNWAPFKNRLWQRNYYEHIVRDEHDYQSIVEYIKLNPQNWDKDEEHLL